MFNIASEIIRYVVFIYLVVQVAYLQRSQNMFNNNVFMRKIGFDTEVAEEVTSPLEIYDYIEGTLENGLYDFDRSDFVGGQAAFFMQTPRMRQWRSRRTPCIGPIPERKVHCIDKFDSIQTRDTDAYGEAWIPISELNITEDDDTFRITPWTYNPNQNLGTYESKHSQMLLLF